MSVPIAPDLTLVLISFGFIYFCFQCYHPNINLQGNVCLNILRDDWRPILNIQNVIHGLIFLFLDPNPDDPLNQGTFRSSVFAISVMFSLSISCFSEAAAVLRRDRATFKSYVDASLRGRPVQGVEFERNPTIKG
jgi:ubiquitin-conjugating enzyme E2 M